MRKVRYGDLERLGRTLGVQIQNERWKRPGRVRAIRTRPRDPAELKVLVQAAQTRHKEVLQSGEFRYLSARRWRLNVTDRSAEAENPSRD